MAFASIFAPNFILQAVVRAEPRLRNRALALVEGVPPLCSVKAINEKASQAGIECGMAKTNAARFSGVEIRPRSRTQEKIAHEALLDIGWSVSPRIENTAEDTIILDLAGLSGLFGAEKDIGAHLAKRACECGLLANITVAANIEAARIAARGFPGITVIPEGEESQYLSSLHVSVLSPSLEAGETLGRWGIQTCAALASLPLLQLSERLGQEGVRLHALARGASLRSLIIAEPDYSFEEEMELDDAVEELDQLSFLLGRLLDQLCVRLSARSLAAAAIHVYFELQPAFENAIDTRKEIFRRRNPSEAYTTNLQLSIPVRDSKMLLKLLRLRLQSNPPKGPIQKLVISADAARPRSTQGGLFIPGFPDPDKLEITIARIANVVGDGNIGSPSLRDIWRPGEFQMGRFLPPAEGPEVNLKEIPDSERRCRVPNATASFRIFRPPVPARIEMHADCPARVIFQGLRGEVRSASGPWRTSGDWWQEDAWQHDEWDLEIHFDLPVNDPGAALKSPPDSGLYRFYYDSRHEVWFVRGMYD